MQRPLPADRARLRSLFDREPAGRWHAAMRTRAVDNGVYLVAATYYDKDGLILHPDGRGLVEAHGKEGVHTADVELTDGQAPSYWVWQWSDRWWWKECYWKERRCEVHEESDLFAPPRPSVWRTHTGRSAGYGELGEGHG